jgi:hypothetical protein
MRWQKKASERQIFSVALPYPLRMAQKSIEQINESQHHWLMKSEPSVYGIADLERDRYTLWEGVRNYQARNFMREMTVGDRVLFYHSNADIVDPSLDPINRARFLLATRQFKAAQEALLEVLKDKKQRLFHDEALRTLLVVAIRIDRNPNQGRELFSKLQADIVLPEEQQRDVDTWIKGFERWSKETTKGTQDLSLAKAEQLIVTGATKGIDYRQDDVSLIRGTAMVHDILEGDKVDAEQRKRALYLLGFAYAHIPAYFAESWSEMYLEQCINEYPGTNEAKRAYRIYREHIIDEFTGSSGTNLPAEVELQLETLRKKAYGESVVSPGKV